MVVILHHHSRRQKFRAYILHSPAEASERVQHHLDALSAAIAEIICADAEWLDREYGFSAHIQALFENTQALFDACENEHQRSADLANAKASSEKAAERQVRHQKLK